MKKGKKIMVAATAVVTVAVILCAGFIAYNRLGLVEGYDFGAGAYYYADIPSFDKVLDEDVFQSKVPVWVHIALFLLWGWGMYRLWCRIEDR